ncbi:polysaccharide pyruvyl transferase CsaB [Virgibacillus halophilus]
MHIVLSGYYGFDNDGDEAILYAIIQALKQFKPDARITVLSNDPEATSKSYGVQAVNRWRPREIYAAIRQSNGLLSGGGSLLQDHTGIRSIPYYTGIMKVAQWLKKPVFVYAQGMGPIQRRHNQWIVKRVLNNASQVTVRDAASMNLLKQLGVSRPIQVVPDPVIGLDCTAFKNEWLEINQVASPIIAVSVRDWPAAMDFKKRIALCLDQLANDGNTIIFVPMHGKLDEAVSEQTATLMEQKSYLVPSSLSLKEKISIIGCADLLIGIRLHALIFSAITNTPFVAISYDPKVDSFASMCDQPVIGHLDQDNWCDKKLLQSVNHIMKNADLQKEKLDSRIRSMQKHATHSFQQAVTELFTGT